MLSGSGEWGAAAVGNAILSGKTVASGVTSLATSVPTALAAAATESWTAVAVGAAVGVVSAAYCVVSAINDRRVAVVISELDFVRQRLEKAQSERREAMDRCDAMERDVMHLKSALSLVDRRLDSTRCPLRSGDGSVPCGVMVKTDATPNPNQ